MLKAITLLPSLVLTIASPAIAQLPQPQSAEGFAADLLGVQERTVKDTSLPTPKAFQLPQIRDPNANLRGPLGNLEIGGSGITARPNPSDVFPKPSNEYNSGMRIRYRLDQ